MPRAVSQRTGTPTACPRHRRRREDHFREHVRTTTYFFNDGSEFIAAPEIVDVSDEPLTADEEQENHRRLMEQSRLRREMYAYLATTMENNH